MLTMRDVAERAGVSISTVSLVLSGRAEGRVRADLREHVRAIADSMGYVPDLMARGLRTRRTKTIGLLSDQVASIPFASQMLGGAQHAAGEAGYLLLLIDTDGDPTVEHDAVTSLLQRNVDALIFAQVSHSLVTLPVVPGRVPVVVLDGRPADDNIDADWVVPDERGGAAAATAMLAEAGHRRIAFATSGLDIPARDLRFRGYLDALETHRLPFDPTLHAVAAGLSTSDAIPVALELLARPDRPTAVFCFGDQVAFGFYQAAWQLGLRIPDDLSIVGFDNQQFVADALRPGLTTIQMPHRAMGEWAAHRAVSRIENRASDGRSASLGRLEPCPPVLRESIAPPPTLISPPPRAEQLTLS